MSDTIFSKIIAGDIPCHKVYEDDMVLAFLDISPLSPGHRSPSSPSRSWSASRRWGPSPGSPPF